MAVKHLIGPGLGFAPKGYLVTRGLGNLTAAAVTPDGTICTAAGGAFVLGLRVPGAAHVLGRGPGGAFVLGLDSPGKGECCE